MYQLIKLLSLSIFIFLLFLLFIGALTNPKTALSFTTVIESPSKIIWQYINDHEKISQWQQNADKVDIINAQEMKKGTLLKIHYGQIEYTEKVIEWFPERKVNRQIVSDNTFPLLVNYITSIELKPLKDGSTEINIAVEYTSRSFFTKIYNQIYLRRHFADQYETNLAKLKNLVEKI